MKNQCILPAKPTHESLRTGHNSWKNPVAVHQVAEIKIPRSILEKTND